MQIQKDICLYQELDKVSKSDKVLLLADNTHRSHPDRNNYDLPDSRFFRHYRYLRHQNIGFSLREEVSRLDTVQMSRLVQVYKDHLPNNHQDF